jgi:3-hydroxyisobutyrate dehydrogenase-like beta-hydroxyacid dehydrogenase
MDKTIAVIGAGLIGRAWAMVFARAGWTVRLTDSNADQLAHARAFIAASFDEQQQYGLVADARAALARIDHAADIESAIEGADWVQENLPEKWRSSAMSSRCSIAHPDPCSPADLGIPDRASRKPGRACAAWSRIRSIRRIWCRS